MKTLFFCLLLFSQSLASHLHYQPQQLNHIARRHILESIAQEITQKSQELGPYVLGRNVTDLINLPDGLRYYVEYEHGRVYWTALNGTYSLIREMWDGYSKIEDANETLGHPLADMGVDVDLQVQTALFQQFQHGRYYWFNQWQQSHIWGPVYDRWLELGGSKGLGFASYQRCTVSEGIKVCKADFGDRQIGFLSLYWTEAAGGIVVHDGLRWELWLLETTSSPTYPLTEEMATPDGWDQDGWYQTFQGPETFISRDGEAGCFANFNRSTAVTVGGVFWNKYKELGGVDGPFQRPLAPLDYNKFEGETRWGSHQDFSEVICSTAMI